MFSKLSINKSSLKKPGVYEIKNKLSGRVYIGSSYDVNNRLQSHEICLRYNNHSNLNLQKSYNEDGAENFSCRVIEYCEREQQAEREQYYFDTMIFAQEYLASNGADKRFLEKSFNLSPTAGVSFGNKHTEEQIARNSKTVKKLWNDEEYRRKQEEVRTPEWNKRRTDALWGDEEKRKKIGRKISAGIMKTIYSTNKVKPCLQYCKDTGNFIAEFRSIAECERKTGVQKQNIIHNLKGDIKYTNGFIFRYKTEDNYPLQIEKPTYYHSEETRNGLIEKQRKAQSKAVQAFCAHTHKLLGTYANARECHVHYGLSESGVNYSTRGDDPKRVPYYFRYVDHTPRKYNMQRNKK